MHSRLIRRKFLDYFAQRGHKEVASSSLVPADDPTLLFTNAGMVQFKRTFLGQEHRDYARATTSQKCVRAGGKHNDLEQVGHTKRHHTFFEMLGNFSFGDYFKKDAIHFAWEFVTSKEWLGIDPERLRVSVHHSDDEARKLWRDASGLPDHRIYGLSDKDNFWQMGDTGPCGPCTEIYVDLEWKPGKKAEEISTADFERLAEEGRFLEIWNLVFMQFDRAADGTLTPLPKPSVDTGAGLERIAAVLQGEDSNFHTDLFLPLLKGVEGLVGKPYARGPGGASYRVLADHARAVTFLLVDGVYPSNEGRGYVLRRILRRAVRHAWLLGRREPTLAPLTRIVIQELGEQFPEIRAKGEYVFEQVQIEEERFLATVAGGLGRMDELLKSGVVVIPGEEAFKLYDTFGFPIDLTQIIAGEAGASVDLAGFEQALESQRRRSRAVRVSQAVSRGPAILTDQAGEWTVARKGTQEFVGYGRDKAETEVLAFRQAGDRVEILLQQNPFYAESGGQVSDTGHLRGQGWALPVDAVHKDPRGTVVGGPFGDTFEPTSVVAAVDAPRRRNIERNHSATHLVHAALRKILGTHVRQQGSMVDDHHLRFDFSHHGPIEADVLQSLEREVNAHIWENVAVTTKQMAYPDALALGAMALFSEKYGDQVRVVTMGESSIELCGGTHVRSTGQIGLFQFASQGGVAAGVRRIEAVTGPEAYALIESQQLRLAEAAAKLKAQPEHLLKKLDQLVAERAKLEAKVSELLRSGGGAGAGGEEREVAGVKVTVAPTDTEKRDDLAAIADAFRDGKKKGAVLVLFGSTEKGGVHVALTDDLVTGGKQAGALIKELGGKGGGRPYFASGSLAREQQPDADTALAKVGAWLQG
jgi:alanyl-tRNA synthetase